MKFIIDRFEGEYAIVELENREMVEILRILLPNEAKEGDLINISIDIDETKERRNRIQEKFNNLFKE